MDRAKLNEQTPTWLTFGLGTLRVTSQRGLSLISSVASSRFIFMWNIFAPLVFLMSTSFAVVTVGATLFGVTSPFEEHVLDLLRVFVQMFGTGELLPLLVVITFGSFIAHELGHAMAAKNMGVLGDGYDCVFLFGVPLWAEIDIDWESFEYEEASRGLLTMYASGVAANIVLVGVSGTALLIGGWTMESLQVLADGPLTLATVLPRLLFWSMMVNASLALTNAAPVLPADGGQIMWRVILAGTTRLGLPKQVGDYATYSLSAVVVIGVLLYVF